MHVTVHHGVNDQDMDRQTVYDIDMHSAEQTSLHVGKDGQTEVRTDRQTVSHSYTTNVILHAPDVHSAHRQADLAADRQTEDRQTGDHSHGTHLMHASDMGSLPQGVMHTLTETNTHTLHPDNKTPLSSSRARDTRAVTDSDTGSADKTHTDQSAYTGTAGYNATSTSTSTSTRDVHLSRLLLDLATACTSPDISTANLPPNAHRFILLKIALSRCVQTPQQALQLMTACTCEKLGRLIESTAGSAPHTKDACSKDAKDPPASTASCSPHEEASSPKAHDSSAQTNSHGHGDGDGEATENLNSSKAGHNQANSVSRADSRPSNGPSNGESFSDTRDEETWEKGASKRAHHANTGPAGDSHGLVNGLVGCVVSYFRDSVHVLRGVTFAQLRECADLSVAMECAAYKGRDAFVDVRDEDLCVDMWYKSMRAGGLGKFSKITAAREAKVRGCV
jgi:hypothetical protein